MKAWSQSSVQFKMVSAHSGNPVYLCCTPFLWAFVSVVFETSCVGLVDGDPFLPFKEDCLALCLSIPFAFLEEKVMVMEPSWYLHIQEILCTCAAPHFSEFLSVLSLKLPVLVWLMVIHSCPLRKIVWHFVFQYLLLFWRRKSWSWSHHVILVDLWGNFKKKYVCIHCSCIECLYVCLFHFTDQVSWSLLIC